MVKNTLIHFKNFFLNFFWLGLVLVLVSIILDLNSPEDSVFIIDLAIKAVETIGLSVFIASLFSFAFQSVSFQNKIQNLVETTVLKRSFLSDLGKAKKKEALHNLLKPTQSEIEKYSNIEDYYNH